MGAPAPTQLIGRRALPGRDLEVDTHEDPGFIPDGFRREMQVGSRSETLHEVGDGISHASVAIDSEHLGQPRVDIGNGEIGSKSDVIAPTWLFGKRISPGMGLESIADPPDGVNIAGMAARFAEFATQAADVGLDDMVGIEVLR